ncbi:O-antigen ligase family protein [Clostridium pasteurianum]|uniref:Lipid A core-O-antigen ligase-like enyme n=1 Tax=Clostridium pasteurianum BC1 TaxID=86416 RepID=R4K5L0_CLOPA|nr:O-antigen ligase family protein [Clostridium pasteurianum]AGK97858.1 lipid A core-O-antigen ligase-like enyme [Clostridium pasteurianum BC1]
MKSKNSLIYYILIALIILCPIMPDGLSIKGLHKIPASGDIMLFILIIVFLVSIFRSKDSFIYNIRNFFNDLMGISLTTLLAIMVISITYAVDRSTARNESARFLSFVILYFIVKYNIDKEKLKGLITAYMVIFTGINLYGIFQKITGYGLLQGYTMGNSNVLRINATFDNQNSFAAFLIIGVFPVIMMIIRSKRLYKKSIYSILFIVTLCNIYFAGSRNSFLALIVGGVIVSLLYSWYFLAALGGITVIAFIIPSVRGRVLQIAVGDEGRIQIWRTALKMIENHPIFGVGNGNFIQLYDSYVAKYKYLAYKNYSHYPTHNSYLKIESELGIIGGLSFISIIVNALIKIKKVIVNIHDKEINLFYIGFLASVVAFLFMNLFENLFFVPSVIVYFWIFLAAADGLLFSER